MTPTIEERVAYLEGKVEEQSNLTFELREMVTHIVQKVDRFREELSIRINSLDHRLSTRIDSLVQKVDRFREELSTRIESLDQKFSRYFLWLIGIQVTILISIIATLLRS